MRGCPVLRPIVSRSAVLRRSSPTRSNNRTAPFMRGRFVFIGGAIQSGAGVGCSRSGRLASASTASDRRSHWPTNSTRDRISHSLSHLAWSRCRGDGGRRSPGGSACGPARGDEPSRAQIAQLVAVQLTVSPELPLLKCEVTLPFAVPCFRNVPVTLSLP